MPKLQTWWDLFGTARDPFPIERDLRVDFFRGLALFCIFIDHLNSFPARFTLQAVMCADAAEVFVFLSGFISGAVYGRTMERNGFLVTLIRIYHRVWQLYLAHLVLFIMVIAVSSYTLNSLNTSRYTDWLGTAIFFKEPGLALVRVLSLQFQPSFMDILPLYIVCLGFLPIVLAGFRSRPRLVILASLSLWLAVQFDGRIALPAWPNPAQGWGFNPFAWQALYYMGAWLAWRNNHEADLWLNRRWLVYLAAGIVVAGFLIRFKWTLLGFYGPISSPIPGDPLWRFMNKMDLGLIRLVNIFAVAVLVSHTIGPRWRFFAIRAARPFVMCGRNSLHIFCLGILLAVFGQLVENEVSGRVIVQFAVCAAGIVIMVGFAGLLEWFAALRAPSGGRYLGAPLGDIGITSTAALMQGQNARLASRPLNQADPT